MKKVLKYKVYTNSNLSSLEAIVNDLLKKGWQPLGGVSTSYIAGSSYFYAQTMVQYEED